MWTYVFPFLLLLGYCFNVVYVVLFVCFFMVNTPCRISFNLATMQLSKIWLYAFKNNNIVHAEQRKPCKTNGNRNNMQWNTGACELEKTDINKKKINFTNVQINFLTENEFFNCCICLFGFFLSHLRIFHSYGDVTITREGSYSALMSIEQWGFFDRYPFIIAPNIPHVRPTF